MARRTITRINGVNYLDDAEVAPTTTNPNIFTDGDATPSVAGGEFFKTANTSATSITNFDSPEGQLKHIVVYINDDDTKIIHDVAKIDIIGDADLTLVTGDVVDALYVGTVWFLTQVRDAS